MSGILSHGCVPDDLAVSTVIPIPKGHNLNLTDSANYRGISLSSMFGKIFDLIVLKRYADHLFTSELQFGFKAKRSTNMCSMVLKECISYYNSNNSTVYCTMLDATKAFDRVEYCKLFRQLITRQIPPAVVRLLMNMYVSHATRVSWNGIFSNRISVRNGVKQGGIISPVLFCIYIDGLLNVLAKEKIGCFIGHFFVGALAYADDIVLLAPTPRAMRTMLKLCDNYANEFNVVFNAKKSKCIVCGCNNNNNNNALFQSTFYIGGNCIEVVQQWPHLGHIITNNLSDTADIQNRRNSLIGQINNVLCYFGKLDPVTKVKLLKAYCSSFYGCELWDLWDKGVDAFCKAWRQGQRSVWKLPYNTHSRFLSILCDDIPIQDEICRRFLSFIHKCISSDCHIVQFVAKYSLLFGRMHSVCGRNALYCANQYKFNSNDILNPHFNANVVTQKCHEQRFDEDVAVVTMLIELVCLRDNIFTIEGFDNTDINSIIEYICTA